MTENENQSFQTDFKSITARIEELREALGYKKKKDFCQKLRFPESSYGGITGSRGTKPNIELIASIAKIFPNANVAWVLTGQGTKLLEKGEVEKLREDKEVNDFRYDHIKGENKGLREDKKNLLETIANMQKTIDNQFDQARYYKEQIKKLERELMEYKKVGND